jgi:hypothetical protein
MLILKSGIDMVKFASHDVKSASMSRESESWMLVGNI